MLPPFTIDVFTNTDNITPTQVGQEKSDCRSPRVGAKT